MHNFNAVTDSSFPTQLIPLGITAETELKFLGQSLKTMNAGIVAIFIGAVLFFFFSRRTFKYVEIIRNYNQ